MQGGCYNIKRIILQTHHFDPKYMKQIDCSLCWQVRTLRMMEIFDKIKFVAIT